MNQHIAKMGNFVYRYSPFLYRPLYTAYKVLSDRPERKLMAEIVKQGMTVIDVGANIGTSTSFLLKLVGVEGEVYAFEPERRNYQLLEAAIKSNANAYPVNAAVGHDSGVLELYTSDELNVDHHTYDDGKGRDSVKVDVIALDEYFEVGKVIDFIKVDVQGYDLHVLQGAKRILRENKNVALLLEYWPYGLLSAGIEPGTMIGFLRKLGFGFKVLGDDSAADIRKIGGGIDEYVNLFAHRDIARF